MVSLQGNQLKIFDYQMIFVLFSCRSLLSFVNYPRSKGCGILNVLGGRRSFDPFDLIHYT